MINIAVVFTGQLENVENIRNNNPSLYKIPFVSDNYKIDFYTSTWDDVYKKTKKALESDELKDTVGKKIITSNRDELYEFFDTNQTHKYLERYIKKQTPPDHIFYEEEYQMHYKFVCDRLYSQFYLMWKFLNRHSGEHDIYIKLRSDTNLNHVDMSEYIEVLMGCLCMERDSRFNTTFLEWFDFQNIESAQKNNLVHIKTMFYTHKIGFMKDQFFAFNKSKSFDLKNKIQRLGEITNKIEKFGFLNGESLWFECLTQDSYVVNDDFVESVI